ncbi:MAG TPA: response regulator transcription factor [Chloroflexi bacterium]|mgnify:FL=1|jgi:DNA-binding NarL/FixJ family response regulator|nr:response regulator transcription factor [Chloroflexota bacterium]
MNILIAEHLALFRDGLLAMLQSEPDLQVVAQASTAQEMQAQALEHRPDLVLMDCELEGDQGLRAMRAVLSRLPEVQFIVLFNDLSPGCFVEAVYHGARGVLPKTISRPMMLSALRAAARGEVIVPRQLVGVLVDELARTSSSQVNPLPGPDGLTYREREVLGLLAAQLSNREIARRMTLSENTVRVYVHNILVKLKLKNRREAAALASRLSLAHLPEPQRAGLAAGPGNGRH